MLHITVNEKKTYQILPGEEQTLVNGIETTPDIRQLPNGIISIIHNGKSYSAIVESTNAENKEVTLNIGGQIYKMGITEPIDILLSNLGMDTRSKKSEPVRAPMPGMVLKILVTDGQVVKKGEPMMILEAMKMENILKAAADCVVKTVRAAERTAVEKGAILIEIE
jgi:biotin carboxyl carrier protein